MDQHAALRDHVKRLILRVCDVKGVAPGDVPDDALLFGPSSPMGLTSLDAIEIAIAIDRELKVKIANVSSARDYFRSVATLSDFIASKADPAVLRSVVKPVGS